MTAETLINTLNIALAVLAIAVAIWLAARSLEIYRPKLLLRLGMAPERGSKAHIHHSIYYLGKDFHSGYATVVFVIKNLSKKTATNVQLEIDLETPLFASSDAITDIKESIMGSDTSNNAYFKSRGVSLLSNFVRVHYHIDAIHPGTTVTAAEPIAIDVSYKNNCAKKLLSNGFDNIRNMVLKNPDMFFSRKSVSLC